MRSLVSAFLIGLLSAIAPVAYSAQGVPCLGVFQPSSLVTSSVATSSSVGAIRRFVRSMRIHGGLDPDVAASGKPIFEVLEHFSATFEGNNGRFFVLRDESAGRPGVVVGTGAYHRGESEGEAVLRMFYLDPSLQGQGLGGRLLQMIIDDARLMGFKRMTLQTTAGMNAAIRAYTKSGFRRKDGDGPLETLPPDHPIYFELDLISSD